MADYDRIFAAVFPPSADVVVPTPVATPVLGSTGLGQSFGGFVAPASEPQSSAEEQIKWDRAWHTATSYLSLPNELVTIAHAQQSEEALRARWLKPFTTEIASAVSYLVSINSPGNKLRRGSNKDNLLQWYYEEMLSRHYVDYVSPTIVKYFDDESNRNALLNASQVLKVALALYLYPLNAHISSFLPENGAQEIEEARQNLYGLFTYSIPTKIYVQRVGDFLDEQAAIVLCINVRWNQKADPAAISDAHEKVCRVMKSLHSVGLAGPKAERLFAEVMTGILGRFVRFQYGGQWKPFLNLPERLRDWIENKFSRFIVDVLAQIRDTSLDKGKLDHPISYGDMQKWQQTGIRMLGELRTEELFDVVCRWNESMSGAIRDLEHYIREGKRRFQLTSKFSEAVSRRLLQPGASTTEILQVYIAIIRAFTTLEPKGVLLDRVARPIRRYLREREDTVNIVVGGLLADMDEDPAVPDTLYDLAEVVEMTGGLPQHGSSDDGGDLNFDDMTWEPDPVDAPLEYMKSNDADIIGALISLFETKEAFTKEFQKILGERLLRKEHEFDKEVQVLEILKVRFGESNLQACEVMLRDIMDSRRVDAFIHKEQGFAPNQRLHTKVLSHLFWPSLHTEHFALPPPVAALQARYADGFSKLKATRKLTWHPSLGQVVVNLDLEDRVVREEVQTWQASVIYAFSSTADTDPTSPITKTVSDLSESLEMSESMVRSALTFWVSKLVLVQYRPDTYRVLETLSSDINTLNPSASSPSTTTNTNIAQAAAVAAASEAVHAAAASSAVKSEEDMLAEKMEVYWNFVKAMLTNQGAMRLERIVMMLKMVVPGGFPFGNDELRAFLGGKVAEGRLEVGAGGFKIVH